MVSRAQYRAVDKYRRNAIDRFDLKLKSGEKAMVRNHAYSRGESINAFIRRAILTQLLRDVGKK